MATSENGSSDMSDVDTAYFASYDDIQVHELMLKDKPRTTAYKEFIENNRDLFIDKIVVDVGAGLGILSLLAAKAGAKKVFAIEAAIGVSNLCKEIVDTNGFSGKITILVGRAEDVSLPDDVRADILISEWMGFYLLHESMLNSVIIARDRFLSPDGIMVPSTASLFMCPISLKDFHKEHFMYWSDVYGFDLSPVRSVARQSRLLQPQILAVPPVGCLAEPQMVLNLELMYVGAEDIHNVKSALTFHIEKYDVLHGFACWFEVEFNGGGGSPTVLSTGPSAPDTHWHQTVVLLPNALLVSLDEEVSCNIQLTQDGQNPRRYNITIEVPEDDDESDEEHSTDMDPQHLNLGDNVLDEEEADVESGDHEAQASDDMNSSLQDILLNAMAKHN